MVKVCGMRSPENIRRVAQTGPDLMGFIFYPESPRHFEGPIPELPGTIKKTGVFVNASEDELIKAAKKYQLDYLQLHGEESSDLCGKLKKAIAENGLNTRIIKVFSVAGIADLDRTTDFAGLVDYFLFDTRGRYRGGNGVAFDWNILKNYELSTPFILSGGISPDDTAAIDSFINSEAGKYCIGVDINSGFETEPGIKDPSRVEQFIRQINRLSRNNNI